jgi:lipopolysaccharide biosynthesis protein
VRRIAIFAHYDAQDAIKPFVLHHLAALREVCDEIHFVSTARLSAEELAKLGNLVASHVVMDNVGYDFGMWARIVATQNLRDWDELVLTNSSVYGPIAPLSHTFQRMAESPCDFWGLTDSLELDYHIQSFFLVMRRRLLHSGAVERFFASILPYRTKWQVIRSYEIGLTHFLLDQGFTPDVLVSVLDPAIGVGVYNPCAWIPTRLVARGMPYVKVALLRDNIAGIRLEPVRRQLAAAGYPMDLVASDSPRPLRCWMALFNALRLGLRRRGLVGGRGPALRSEVLAMTRPKG